MILGIGTDICDICRIEKLLEDHDARFKAKTFTEDEQAYCDSWTDVSVKNDPSGRPTVLLSGTAKYRLDAITPAGHVTKVQLSLSDDYPYATAFAVVEAVKEV